MRVVFSDNGTLTDYTKLLEDYYSGSASLSIKAAEDALYIGSKFPFNSFFIKVGTANSSTCAMTVKYWDYNVWQDVNELFDETSVGGKTLAVSGKVSFVPDKDQLWARSSTNYGGEVIPVLSSISIYDCYWIKITFSADITVAIPYIGHKFCNDNDLGVEYPDLNKTNVKTAFASGKTDWEEQIVRASDILLNDLKTSNMIFDEGQILDTDVLKFPTVSKVAEMIYSSFGDDYKDNESKAKGKYWERVRSCRPVIDLNMNAIEDQKESKTYYGVMYR